MVILQAMGKKRHAFVQWLVLEAFVGPCPDGMECRHFPDRDPTNNRLDNVRWGTAQENSDDKKVHGTNNGWTLSEETKAKMSASRTGMRRSAESVAKTAAGLRGRKLSEEHCQKLSKSHMGNTLTEETKAKMSKAQRARWRRRKEGQS